MSFTAARTTMRLLLDPTERAGDEYRVGKERLVLRVGVQRAAVDIVLIAVAISFCICMHARSLQENCDIVSTEVITSWYIFFVTGDGVWIQI